VQEGKSVWIGSAGWKSRLRFKTKQGKDEFRKPYWGKMAGNDKVAPTLLMGGGEKDENRVRNSHPLKGYHVEREKDRLEGNEKRNGRRHWTEV